MIIQKIVCVFKISLIHFVQLISNTFDWQPVAWWRPVSVCSSSRWYRTNGRTWGCPVCLGRCLLWAGTPWTFCPLNCSPPMSGTETLRLDEIYLPLFFIFFYLHNMKISIDSIIIFSCYIYDTFFIQILSVQLKIYTITLSINIQMHFACNFMENSK